MSRVAIAAFAVVVVYAFAWWLNLGRHQWFYADEWEYLSNRTAWNLGDLFRPHHGHWTTLPILQYRFLYQLFGLNHFFPYRLVVLVLYMVAAALLLAVMWRAGVHPFIAVSAATLFALFGAGSDNIINPFQVTFTGALVAGLVLLILTDHDGPFERRDWFGMLAGLVALMMSGAGVVMVMITAVAVLCRRGWRTALTLVAPLAAIYVVWFLAIGHNDGVTQAGSVSQIGGIVSGGLRNAFRVMAPRAWLGLPLALLLIGGFVLAARQRTRAGWAQLAVPFALLCGTVLLLASVASDHADVLGTKGAGFPRQSRYVSLLAALSIPALAVAADAIARLWKWLIPLAMALFLVRDPAQPRRGPVHRTHQAPALRGHASRGRDRPAFADRARRAAVGPSRHPHRARAHRRMAARRGRAGQDPVARSDDADQPRQGRLPALLPAGGRRAPAGPVPGHAQAHRREVAEGRRVLLHRHADPASARVPSAHLPGHGVRAGGRQRHPRNARRAPGEGAPVPARAPAARLRSRAELTA